MIVVDDRLLFDVIAGTEPTKVATDRIEGALSRHYAGLPADRRADVRRVLDDLSDRIEIVSPKKCVPVMSAVATMATVNVLTADVVASALILDAPIVVSTRSDLLERAAAVAGVPTRHLPRDG